VSANFTHPDVENAKWFAEEVEPHHTSLKRYLQRSYPAVRDVDDVVQESYLRLWRAHLLRPVRSAKSFLFQVARNLAVDLIRRNRRSPEISSPDLDVSCVLESGPGVAETACTLEELDLLARAIEALPDRYREVMILRQIKGIPQKEIAVRLGISELSVQTYVVRGLRRLEESMRRHRRMP
jgi:RNA polymerase sigma-70 factor (ECF subfamily)